MRLKKGVKIQGITPELLFGLFVANEVYKEHGRELVITSLNDGYHSLTSLHYSGNAGDLRIYYFDTDENKIKYFPKDETKSLQNEIKKRLSIDYDIVIEEDHIHLEFQPRRRN